MPRNNATSPAKITAAARRREVVTLRMMGQTYAEIAEALGVSRQQAHRLVTAEIGRMAAEAATETEHLRALEVERLDCLLQGIWPDAESGNLPAIDRALKIAARRAALLGLDRPIKVAPTNPAGESPYEGGGLAALLASVAG